MIYSFLRNIIQTWNILYNIKVTKPTAIPIAYDDDPYRMRLYLQRRQYTAQNNIRSSVSADRELV